MNRKATKRGKPRSPWTAYNFFFKYEQTKLKQSASKRGSAISYIGAKWRSLDEESMEHYRHLALMDKRRYAIELIRWKQACETYERKGVADIPEMEPDQYRGGNEATNETPEINDYDTPVGSCKTPCFNTISLQESLRSKVASRQISSQKAQDEGM